MLRIVILSAVLILGGVALAPAASANNICEEGIIGDTLAGDCSPRGIVCNDVSPYLPGSPTC